MRRLAAPVRGRPPMRSSPGRSTGGRMSAERCSASGNARSPTAVNPLPRGLRAGPAPTGDSGDRPCGNGCCGPAGRLTRDPLPARRDACGPLVAEHQSRGRIDQNDLAVVQPVSNRIGQCTTYEDYWSAVVIALGTVPNATAESATACRPHCLRNGKYICPVLLPQETQQSQYTRRNCPPIHEW